MNPVDQFYQSPQAGFQSSIDCTFLVKQIPVSCDTLSVDSCLLNSDKATNPSNQEDDWEAIMAFCDQINKELEGPQIAVRLLAHKIQSPQDRESLYALTVSSRPIQMPIYSPLPEFDDFLSYQMK